MRLLPRLSKVLTALTLTASAIITTIHFYPATSQVPNTKQISQAVRTLSGHTAPIRAIAFQGEILASGGDDKTIKLWNLKTGELLYTLTGHSDAINKIAIAPDGQTVVSGSSDKTIKLWNVKTGQLIKTLTGHSAAVTSVVITPDGIIASAGQDKTIKLWNLNGLQRTLKAEAFSLTISRDGKTLFSGGEQGKIKLWNFRTGKLLRTLILPRPKDSTVDFFRTSKVLSLAISPDGQTLVNGAYNDSHLTLPPADSQNVKVWNLKTGKVLHSLFVGFGSVDTVAFSPDGQTFATGGLTHEIQLWNLKTGKLVNKLSGHAGGVYGLAFSPDGKIIVSGSGDKSIKIWQVLP
jgi:WD40 repeat protein